MKVMGEPSEKNFNISMLMKIHYKPEYSNLFNKIKDIRTPAKNHILISLLDGKWHNQYEILRITRKQDGSSYLGSVTLSTMIEALNSLNGNNKYLKKKIVNGKIYYKLSDNYLGLTRAAFTKLRHIKL